MLPGYELPKRTRRTCKTLKWFSVGVAVFSLYVAITYDMIGIITDQYWEQLSDAQRDAMVYTDFKKRAVTTIAIFSEAASYWPIFGAFHLFRQFEKGAAFSLSVAKAIRFMGTSIIIYIIMDLMVHPMMIGTLTYDLPAGKDLRTFSFVFYTKHAQALTFGALFLIIGQIFTQAVRISDENRQIV